MSNNTQPEIRFPGFTEDWEQRKLGDFIDVKSGKDYKHLNSGSIPVYGTGGYMLSVDRALSDIDAIGIGRKGTIDKPYLLKAPFWTVDTLFYAVPKQNIDLQFSLSIFKKINWKKFDESTGVPSLSKTVINSVGASVPSYEEQQKIGSFFKQLDDTIALHQRKLDLLKETKKGFLQKMFPKNGAKVPEIRFPGFTEDWEQRKVGEIFKVTRGQVLAATETSESITEKNIYPVYSSQTKNDGLMGYYSDYLFDTAITWTTDGANAGTVNYRNGKFYSTNVNGVLLSDKGYANKAVAEIINRIAWKHVSKVGNPKLMNNVMSEIIITIPSVEEQETISRFFTQLDSTITLHERELDLLKETKKGFLQKMFV
ncbi:restriction endonuclease subunit S [Enterococcus hirae]|uniref:restriction endonuclease subunit S n=1 Tax=Enterococcus hirae TaxID=1354 RepID=UPI00201A1929|nr:restriction endonuclease subunit S [Enterococcus hirae]UQN38028.1 restriction endonuclease subunit S [Enterococcus hirae]